MAAQRKQAAQRQRRIIFNNDGNDVAHFPSALEPTDANVLSLRTTPLLNTHVDSFSYCTNRGIGLVLHRSKVNEMLLGETRDKKGVYADKRNIVAELQQRGTDGLEIMVRFGRKYGKEIFWSMRMNDIHDAQNGAMLSRFKKENPHVLFGSVAKPPPYRGYADVWSGNSGTAWGGYSGVDYAQPEVRELVFRTIAEVCAGYDIDGVELDFFRSPVLFKSQAWGKQVSREETDSLTTLLARIRTMADDAGRSRGRPILLSVHVPDSVRYCQSIGIDLEKWLGDGLIDLLLPGGDFLLSPWETAVELGHRHGVAVYPSVTRAPTSANPGYGERAAPECYRGRALRAWGAGADGISMFNMFDPSLPLFKELGNPATLRLQSRTYFGSDMPTWHSRCYHKDGLTFRTLPQLSPEHPHSFTSRQEFTTSLQVPEDPQSLRASRTQLALHLKLTPSDAGRTLKVQINGHPLSQTATEKEWQIFEVRPDWVLHGQNSVKMVGVTGQVLSDIRLIAVPVPEK